MTTQTVWTQLEREYGLRFPLEFRARVEARNHGYDDYVEDIKADVAAFLELLPTFEHLPEPISEQSRNRTKRYLAPFRQRLHLVDFVLSRHVTAGEVLSRRVNVRHRRRRINWREMYEEWNREHPAREAKSSPASLKAAYYSAIKEQAVQYAYFAELNERWDGKVREMAVEFLEANPQLAEKLARTTALMRQVGEGLQQAGGALHHWAFEAVNSQRRTLGLLSRMRQWAIGHEQQYEGFRRLAKVNTPEARNFCERWGGKSPDSFTESDWQAMQAEIDSLTAIHDQPVGPNGGEQPCGEA